MYKIIFVFLAIMGIATASCAQQKQGANRKQPNNKVFIAYFSATGTTAGAAEKLSKVTGGELYEITPAQPYTNADPKSRPAIRKSSIDIADYDVIFVGYPIWWNLAPRIINTFIESYHLKNKPIILFATSGSSSITNSMATLKKSYPDLIWKEGKLLNGMNENDIREWISKLDY